MRDDLRIAVRNEPMPACPQFIPTLDVIKKLAVKDDDDVTILVVDRLLAVCQTDNAQPARSQDEPGPNQKSLLVGTTVQQRAGHSLNAPLGDRTLSRQIDHACDAAHQ